MSSEKVAIIGGTGELGFGLALRWARAGVGVLIGSREEKKAQEAAARAQTILRHSSLLGESMGLLIEGCENARAASQVSMVVLTVPFPAQLGILKSIRGSLKEAVLVDTTVPLAATLGGKATRLVGVWQGSAAEQAREIVPVSIPVLAAFHHLAAPALQDLSVKLDSDVLICGDDEEAKERLFSLVRLIAGLRPLDAGPLEMARIAEAMTALLVGLNRRYRTSHSGVRITGIDLPAGSK